MPDRRTDHLAAPVRTVRWRGSATDRADPEARGQTLPAGSYTVQSDRTRTVVQSADLKTAPILLPHAVQDTKMSGVAALRFNRYGTRYFLSQIWMGSPLVQELPKSRAEREQIAASGASHAVVAITAGR